MPTDPETQRQWGPDLPQKVYRRDPDMPHPLDVADPQPVAEPLSDAELDEFLDEFRHYMKPTRVVRELRAAREQLAQAEARETEAINAFVAVSQQAANGRDALYVLNQKVEEERTKTRAAEAACADLFRRLEAIQEAWIEQDARPYDIGNLIGAALNLRGAGPGDALLARMALLEAVAVEARKEHRGCSCRIAHLLDALEAKS